jgi:hypothetical protein
VYSRKIPVTWIESLSAFDEEFDYGLSFKSFLYLVLGLVILVGSIKKGGGTLTGKTIVGVIVGGLLAIFAFYKGKSVPPEVQVMVAINYYFNRSMKTIDEYFEKSEKMKAKKKAEQIRSKVLASPKTLPEEIPQEKTEEKKKRFSFFSKKKGTKEEKPEEKPKQQEPEFDEEALLQMKLRKKLRVVEQLKKEAADNTTSEGGETQ